MRRRVLRLPMLSVRTTVIICGCLVALCACIGLAMRMSLTNYANDGVAVQQLPFVVSARASEEDLRLYAKGEGTSAVIEPGLQGETRLDGDSGENSGMTPEEELENAPIVITATFKGKRNYVYQAFQCHLEVTSALRGDDVKAGDDLIVYDAYKIAEPHNGLGIGQFSRVREVWGASSGPSMFGLMPMRDGQEYLLFLEPKVYPREKNRDTYKQTFCLIEHPYSRISLDIAEHPERVGIYALPVDGAWPRIAFADACQYDLAVESDVARDVYLENCVKLLSNYTEP